VGVHEEADQISAGGSRFGSLAWGLEIFLDPVHVLLKGTTVFRIEVSSVVQLEYWRASMLAVRFAMQPKNGLSQGKKVGYPKGLRPVLIET
jgi:uncharacterized membrane protein